MQPAPNIPCSTPEEPALTSANPDPHLPVVASLSPPPVHFGAGEASSINRLRVWLPCSAEVKPRYASVDPVHLDAPQVVHPKLQQRRRVVQVEVGHDHRRLGGLPLPLQFLDG
jgi:hypothetical protein